MRTSLRKAYEITDARIQFVSLVDKAANQRTFLLTKAADGEAAFKTCGRILKADAATHHVTGVVYEPMVEDSHGNFMTEEEITKAAYWFAKNGDKVDIQHSFVPFENAAVVENWIAKADFEINGEKVSKGTWLMTMEVADESVWEAIEKGEITGFSMGGIGNYSEEDVELDTVNKQEAKEKKGLLKQLAQALGVAPVEKGAVAELFTERSKGNLFWEAFYALKDTLERYDQYSGRYEYESDEEKVRECLEDFSKIITDILTDKEPIVKSLRPDEPELLEKAGKKMSGKNKAALSAIYESLGAFVKEFDDPEETEDDKKQKEEKEVTKQEVEAVVETAISKAMGGGAESTPAGNPAPETATPDITPETIQKMVDAAIEKAMKPQQESVTIEQVQNMITAAVEKAVEPVLKSKGLPSNLGGSIEKSAGSEQHYLSGII